MVTVSEVSFDPPDPTGAWASPPGSYALPPADRISARWAAFRLGLLPYRVRVALLAGRYSSDFLCEAAVARRDLACSLWDLRAARDILAAGMPAAVHAGLGEALDDLEAEVIATDFHGPDPSPRPNRWSRKAPARYGPPPSDRLAVLAPQAVGNESPLQAWLSLGVALGEWAVAFDDSSRLSAPAGRSAVGEIYASLGRALHHILAAGQVLSPAEVTMHPLLMAGRGGRRRTARDWRDDFARA